MEKEELDRIIKKLESQNSKDIATFGLFYRDGEDELHLKANKDGFELFAAELLKASRDSEKVINDSEKNYIDFGFNEKWIEGELIAYFKPIAENRDEVEPEKPYMPTFKDDLFKFGCFTLLGLLLLCVIIGFYTVVNWFF